MDIVLEDGKGGVELNVNEQALMDEIQMKPSEKRTVSVNKRPPVFRRPEPTTMMPPQQQEMGGMDDLFNPVKSNQQNNMEGPVMWDGQDGPDEDQDQGGYEPSPAQVPSDGYKSIEDEKADLLNKLSRLQKKGFNVSGRINMYSNIEEIRTEYKRITYQIETDQSVKFQRRILMACVTGLEFLNTRYDPFDVQLEGWSDDMMRNIDEYDTVFEELHAKYKDKVAMAPEVKLIMMVGGSAMMFHLTNSMFKSKLPNLNNVNPEMMKNLMESLAKSQGGGEGAPRPPTPVDPSTGRREMKPPGMDLSSLMGGFMAPPPPSSTRTKPRVEDADNLSDIVSEIGTGDVKEISVAGDKKKATKKKKSVTLEL
jgi:hypothetical protein